MALRNYYLGCPMWGLADWVGNLYTRRAKPADFLAQYAAVFNTVEGNTTFYSTPAEATVEKWRDAVPKDFRFSFKIPRTITHEMRLQGDAERELDLFLERMAPLGERLGTFMLQLPPSFGPDQLELLDCFLLGLPVDYHFGVELRHPQLAPPHPESEKASRSITHRGCERIWMDTRPMRAAPEHPEVQAALQKKPDLPVEYLALGPHPILRFVGHPEDEVNEPFFDLWVPVIAGWIRKGLHPYLFMHCPNDLHAPRLARRLHSLLAEQVEVGEMPEWPGEHPSEKMPEQLSLF